MLKVDRDIKPKVKKEIKHLVCEYVPEKKIEDLILSERTSYLCNDFINEWKGKILLRPYNIEPRSKMLISGRSGSGKTSLAEAIAEKLLLPVMVVQSECLISQDARKTLENFEKILNYIEYNEFLLFFDDIDSVYEDEANFNKILRPFLRVIENIKSNIVVVATIQYCDLLDDYFKKRFDVLLSLENPGVDEIIKLLRNTKKCFGDCVQLERQEILEVLVRLNFYEIDCFLNNLLRKLLLKNKDVSDKDIIKREVENWEKYYLEI